MKIIQFSFDADIVKNYHSIESVEKSIKVVKKDKKIQKGDYIIEGYIMTSDIDSGNTIITDEAIKHSKNDLLKYSTVLFNHNMDRPIGKILETDFDKNGLWVKIKLSKSEGKIWTKVQEGIISKFSIKGKVIKEAIEEINPKKKKEGDKDEDEGSLRYRMFMNPDKFVRKITRLELFEASLVSIPANVKARAINWYVEKAIKLEEMKKNKIKNVKKIKDIKSNILGLSDKSENVYEINNTDTIELDGNKFRKQLLKTGKWYHWDADGGILDINKDSINTIAKNFKDKTIEHVYVPLSHTSDPIKNAGEVVDLIPTEDGLDIICEIKDEKVAQKIRDGLIKCVSASIDEDYMNKKSGEQVGPTLLHAALVAEPYIKGMSGFTELSEEFSDKNIISLSDTKPTTEDMIELFKNDLKKQITKEIKLELEEERKKKKMKKKEENKEEKKEKKKIEKQDEEGQEEEQEEKPKKKKKKKVVKKSAYSKCIGREMKDGKTMAEAAKICKEELKKDVSENKVEKKVDEKTKENKTMKKIKKSKTISKDIKVEVKSLEDKISKALGVKSDAELKNRSEAVVSEHKVDLAEAERVYYEYLGKGKVVPAQKEVVISLLTSKSEVNLGDEQVDIKKILTSFLDKQPKIVDFEEKGTQEIAKLKKKKNKGVPQDVKDFYGNMGLDENQTREAWKYARKAANKAKEDKSTLF